MRMMHAVRLNRVTTTLTFKSDCYLGNNVTDDLILFHKNKKQNDAFFY
jgi:hypothetical protein